MAKNLVIVESPAKSKTIEKYLGKDYTVVSSKGHVRDLSTKGKFGFGSYRQLTSLWRIISASNTPRARI